MKNTVYMLDNVSGYFNNGQMNSFIVETETEELIVIDGGYRPDCEHLLEQLQKISGKSKPRIAGWFLTHAHLDHIDCFMEMMEKHAEDVEVQHVYYNFPSSQFVAKNEPWEAGTIVEFYKLLPRFADRAVIVTEGDQYEIGGALFEILYSPNPAWTDNALNNSSIVIRLTLGGKIFLFLGDLGAEGGFQILEKYGAKLKSDYCQMAHHGQNGVTKEVYEAIAPQACLWNAPRWLWDNDRGGGFDSYVYKTVRVREWMDEIGVQKHYVMKDGDQVITIDNFPVKKMMVNGVDISEYVIVCAKDAKASVRKAAETLAEFMQKATGKELRIVEDEEAAVGRSKSAAYEIVIDVTNRDTEAVKQARASIRNDGYAILAEGNRLFITGGAAGGALSGVCAFLEDYVGVRFYAGDYTVIHEAACVEVPANIHVICSPAIEYRDVGIFEYISDPELAGRNKIKSDNDGAPMYAGGFVHTLSMLAEEPMIVGHQPCLTDETVYQKVLTNVKKWLDENPGATIVSVSQNDSYPEDLGCQCEKCKAIDEAEGTPMGSLLTFVNRIAGDIKEEYPGVYVDTLAYRYTRKAPKNIVPAENVVIRLCSIECCFAHAMDNISCEANIDFCKDIEAWSKICKRLYVWDYCTNFMYYLAPFPNLKVLWNNVRFLKEHNVVGIYALCNHQSIAGEFGELRGYLLAKLLWNPDMTENDYYALMDEFLRDYYGAGWKYVREYIDKTSELAAENHLGIYNVPTKYMKKRYAKKADVENNIVAETAADGAGGELTRLWDQAFEAAITEEHKNHIRKSRLQDEFYNLYADFDNQVERNERFYKALREFGVTSHRECRDLPVITDFSLEPKEWFSKKDTVILA